MKTSGLQVEKFIDACLEANTIEEIVKIGSVSYQDMGFSCMIFHYIPHLGAHDYNTKKIAHVPKDHKNWMMTTFPKYIHVTPRDPFESYVLNNGDAEWIGDLRSKNEFQTYESREFLSLMTSYFGYSLIVPAFGPRRSRGYFILPNKEMTKRPTTQDIATIEYMCSFFHRCYTKLRADRYGSVPLTPRENEVLQLIPLGLSNREIAEILKISHHTVNGYTKQLFDKLDVTDRVLLSQRAFALDLIE